MQTDTLEAVRSCPAVARVVVVADVPGDSPHMATLQLDSLQLDTLQVDAELITLVQRSPGLNGALADGARYAARQWPTSGIVAIVGDLPALTALALQQVLDKANGVPHGFVADAAGTGTTILTARAGTLLRPRFGLGSAGRHMQDAIPLPAGEAARRDVDTMTDLHDAARIGLGRATSVALRAADGGAGFIRTGHDVGYEPADRGDRSDNGSRGHGSGG